MGKYTDMEKPHHCSLLQTMVPAIIPWLQW